MKNFIMSPLAVFTAVIAVLIAAGWHDIREQGRKTEACIQHKAVVVVHDKASYCVIPSNLIQMKADNE